jgi:foldase protein PrsA
LRSRAKTRIDACFENRTTPASVSATMPHSMRSPARSISALGAVFFAAVGIAACGGGGIPSDAVVQVNGNPVTKSTFEHWIKVAASTAAGTTGSKPVIPDPPSYSACIAHLQATQPKPAKGQSAPSEAQLKTQCEEQYATLKKSTLSFLIQSEWIIAQAKEMNLSASNQEVEKVFVKLKKQQFPKESEFQKFLNETGQTVSDLLLRVKVQSVLSPKIEQKVTKEAKKSVTKAEAEKYYAAHKSLYGQPERRNMLIVLTKTEAQAKSAKAEIESGKSFATVAKAHSIDPVSKAKGGELANVEKGQQEKALSEAVFSAKPNTLGGPVKTSFGYYIFEVKKVLPASQESLSKVEPSIEQQLAAEREQKKLAAFVKEFKKRWKAKTECRSAYMVELCNGYVAPKATTGTGAATPSTTSTSKTK